MPTSSLQGLNLIYPPSSASTSDEFFPDISAQLDLWTNLTFASDETLAESHLTEDSDMTTHPKEMPSTPSDELSHQRALSLNTLSLPPMQTFDINNFIAGFGIDPFLAPLQPLTDSDGVTATLSPTSSTISHISPPGTDTSPQSRDDDGARARGTKRVDDEDPLTTPVTATEDKRRRNTAASARFRAKKKEREHAMEKRSKELENRVTELERECEGLRRENGWLKGLVVGVTSGNPGSIGPPPTTEGTSASLETEPPETGQKRKRAE